MEFLLVVWIDKPEDTLLDLHSRLFDKSLEHLDGNTRTFNTYQLIDGRGALYCFG